MPVKTLDNLFHETLRDIYYAERKIVRALPRMRRTAQSLELQDAFDHHKEETEDHIERLQKVFEMIDKRPRGKTCEAIDGIIEEAESIMAEFRHSPALDAGLLAAAQAIEHYEISRYGTLKAWAERLGLKDASKLLDETLREEAKADETLTRLAETAINSAAEARAA